MPFDGDVPFDRRWTRRLSDRTVREAVLHPRRRFALYYLRERADPVEVEELADQITAWERKLVAENVSDDGAVDEAVETEAVVASLRSHHIPYLVERDVVAYDPQRDRVVYDTDDSTLAMFLANDPRTSVPWHLVYLALTAVSAAFVGLVWLDVGPFAGIRPVTVAGVVVVLFTAASAVHRYDVYRWRRDNEGEPPDFLVTLGDDISERVREDEVAERTCEGGTERDRDDGRRDADD